MKKIIIIAVLATGMTGCAFNSAQRTGNMKLEDATQESLIDQFKPEVTTRDDVVGQFGPPDKKITAGSMEVWTYSYKSSAYVVFVFASVPIGIHKAANFYFDEKTGLLKKIQLEAHRG
ncbi:hypothetical protein [Caballeronia sp. LZ035]|uniref:hypothetical protein n=1 Tax=Caballeronia sp. LZ035 TaxID=3038568 RepID=UPI00285CAA3D|nr:hypothetical protein [Caballeronia sp. LZ035]MDR5762503.1 hypothetical protein [Caballeronia sp. LZ035]